MPNYCDYKMKVRGIPKNVDEFIDIIQADYDKRHLYRVFEADVIHQDIDVFGLKTVLIDGYCAWSVYSCMMEGDFTYFSDNRLAGDDNNLGTSLIIESKRLNLIIEVYSDEPGMGFQEHIYICNGEVIDDGCLDANHFWFGDNLTLEEFKEDWKIDDEYLAKYGITNEIFEKYKNLDVDYIVGGYLNEDNQFTYVMDNLPKACKVVK